MPTQEPQDTDLVPAAPSRLPHLLLMVAILLVMGGVTVTQNVRAIRRAYRIEQLRTVQARLEAEREQLEVVRAQKRSPAALLERAEALGIGLVPSSDRPRSLPWPGQVR